MALDFSNKDHLYHVLWADIDDFWEQSYISYSDIDFSSWTIPEIVRELEFLKDSISDELSKRGLYYTYHQKLYKAFDRLYILHGPRGWNIHKMPQVHIEDGKYAIQLKKSREEIEQAIWTILLEVGNILQDQNNAVFLDIPKDTNK